MVDRFVYRLSVPSSPFQPLFRLVFLHSILLFLYHLLYFALRLSVLVSFPPSFLYSHISSLSSHILLMILLITPLLPSLFLSPSLPASFPLSFSPLHPSLPSSLLLLLLLLVKVFDPSSTSLPPSVPHPLTVTASSLPLSPSSSTSLPDSHTPLLPPPTTPATADFFPKDPIWPSLPSCVGESASHQTNHHVLEFLTFQRRVELNVGKAEATRTHAAARGNYLSRD